MWARAMFKYHHVAKSVEPKRQKLRGAEEELSVTMAQLEAARAELKGEIIVWVIYSGVVSSTF